MTQGAAVVLLAMSVASWVVMLWKARLVLRAGGDVARCTAAVWQSPSLDVAAQRLAALDSQALVAPLVAAAQGWFSPLRPLWAHVGRRRAFVATAHARAARCLARVLGRLQYGQVLLATVGATAPFVGLLGTVWGIYHALTALGGGGQVTIDRLSGPVGEALVMTAAGLAVAIPAVLAYNVFGRLIGRIEADLEGFALDLRELLAGTPRPSVKA